MAPVAGPASSGSACEGLTQAVFVVGVGDGFGEGVSGDYSIYKAKRSP